MIKAKKIEEIQNILQYKFKNLNNLKSSLIHPSSFKKNKSIYIYEFERLEFLGDRVLGLAVAFLIFNKFKDYNEGDLSKKFSSLVQRDFLYKIALKINLENYLIFNKQKKSDTRLNKSILADSFESLIGAIYIDGGYHKSYSVIKRIWKPYLNELITAKKKGYQSYLLYLIQREDCKSFKIAKDIDEEYKNAYDKALKNGVKILCYDCKLNNEEIKINNQIDYERQL